jgi:hypothetical protein
MQTLIDVSGKVFVLQVSETGARCTAEMRMCYACQPIQNFHTIHTEAGEKHENGLYMVVVAGKSTKRNWRCEVDSME